MVTKFTGTQTTFQSEPKTFSIHVAPACPVGALHRTGVRDTKYLYQFMKKSL